MKKIKTKKLILLVEGPKTDGTNYKRGFCAFHMRLFNYRWQHIDNELTFVLLQRKNIPQFRSWAPVELYWLYHKFIAVVIIMSICIWVFLWTSKCDATGIQIFDFDILESRTVERHTSQSSASVYTHEWQELASEGYTILLFCHACGISGNKQLSSFGSNARMIN